MISRRLFSGEALRIVVLGCVIASGVFLRIRYYAMGFSLFLDECALAINLVQRPYAALSQPLDFGQAAPLGFLYLVKLTTPLGSDEFAFRLIPLISSLGAIVAFYFLTRQIFSGWALVAANLLMCANQTAISYSAQTKQYSLELLVAVLMLILSRPLFDPNSRPATFWLSTLALGSLAWFSFSSVFVLAGIALALMIGQARNWCGRDIPRTAGVLLLWGVLITPVYLISIRASMANPALRSLWIADYFPLNALSAPHWILSKIQEISVLSFNKRLWPMIAAAPLLGLVASIRRRELVPLAGAASVLACLGAAILQTYPFAGRLILFLVPMFIILIVSGYQWLRSLFSARILVAADLIAALALIWCLGSAVKAYGFRPGFIDQPREVLRFVRSNWQPGDRLYATTYSTPCVMYYGRTLDWPSSAVALNVSAVDGAQHSPSALSVPVSAGRSWLVEMRTDWQTRGESVPVREFFESRGKQLAQKDAEWTSAILYQVR